MTANRSFLPRALLLDFYGTIVEEDAVHIGEICHRIAEASPLAVTPEEIGDHWSRVFSRMCFQSSGNGFKPQKELERLSLLQVLQRFRSDLDPDALSRILVGYWAQPRIRPESREVLAQCRIPICLVSNIDNAELGSALRYNDLAFDEVVTSEDCKAYKPRPEIFDKALALLDLSAAEVLHVVDSLGSDVRGASALGIRVLWINRRAGQAPTGHAAPDYEAPDLRGLLSFLKSP
jgi:2-haloacid dehalogenase/putative hydrolase of the HAD superfamily